MIEGFAAQLARKVRQGAMLLQRYRNWKARFQGDPAVGFPPERQY